LVPELVVVLARRPSRVDRDDSDGGGLVQCVRRHLSPRLLDDHGRHSSTARCSSFALLTGSLALGDAGTPERRSSIALTCRVAARAASQPLFPWAPPARSSA